MVFLTPMVFKCSLCSLFLALALCSLPLLFFKKIRVLSVILFALNTLFLILCVNVCDLGKMPFCSANYTVMWYSLRNLTAAL